MALCMPSRDARSGRLLFIDSPIAACRWRVPRKSCQSFGKDTSASLPAHLSSRLSNRQSLASSRRCFRAFSVAFLFLRSSKTTLTQNGCHQEEDARDALWEGERRLSVNYTWAFEVFFNCSFKSFLNCFTEPPLWAKPWRNVKSRWTKKKISWLSCRKLYRRLSENAMIFKRVWARLTQNWKKQKSARTMWVEHTIRVDKV